MLGNYVTIVWKSIKNRSFGVEFHRQVPLNEYIVDFYSHEIQLAIEIDGPSHNSKYDYDCKRQNILENLGVTFVRFTNKEVKKELSSILKRLAEIIVTLKMNYKL